MIIVHMAMTYIFKLVSCAPIQVFSLQESMLLLITKNTVSEQFKNQIEKKNKKNIGKIDTLSPDIHGRSLS